MSGGELGGGGGGGRSLNKILKCSPVLRNRVFCNIVNNIYLFSLIKTKKLASKAHVNIIPGVNEAVRSAEEATTIARSIGYPVMIKAANGGGGKGLRVAHHDQQISQAFTSCQSEARASFASEDVFIEKLIEAPRHIEIQILADAQGNMVYLGERECSIQRRHQKLIEEAPSPFINASTRQAMGEQALMLARAVNYQSVGTVEFVVAPDQSFYFLEMKGFINTKKDQ